MAASHSLIANARALDFVAVGSDAVSATAPSDLAMID
jgi:hypothetical protein